MDTLGIKNPVTPVLPKPASSQSAPVLPKPASVDVPVSEPVLPDFSAQAAEQKRQQAIRQMAQQIANTYVVSDKTFSLFKDSTGQYVTRFTSLRDGKVTYIPEPQLMKMSSSTADVPSVLKIQA